MRGEGWCQGEPRFGPGRLADHRRSQGTLQPWTQQARYVCLIVKYTLMYLKLILFSTHVYIFLPNKYKAAKSKKKQVFSSFVIYLAVKLTGYVYCFVFDFLFITDIF